MMTVFIESIPLIALESNDLTRIVNLTYVCMYLSM